ncbi:Probable ADP-ribosylation factor GTPase-activating protein AGD15 [Linum perenne]
MQCSGIHRSLGVHISQVRSITLDTWLPDHVALMQYVGNEKANKYWEAELPSSYDKSGIEKFIHNKYVDKKWASKKLPQPTQAIARALGEKKVETTSRNHRRNAPKQQHRRRHSLDEITFSKYIPEMDAPSPLKSRAVSLDMRNDILIPKIKHDSSIHNINNGGAITPNSTMELLNVLRDQDKAKQTSSSPLTALWNYSTFFAIKTKLNKLLHPPS